MAKKGKKGKKGKTQPWKHVHLHDGATVPRFSTGTPGAVRVRLTYVESGYTTGASGYLTIRGNDLFDPQAAVSGFSGTSNQQPQFFDVWKLMFSKYRVVGGDIDVKVVPSTSNLIGSFWSVCPEDALVTSTNAVQSSVQRFSKNLLLGTGPSSPTQHTTHAITTARINGVSDDEVFVNPNYQALTTTTPSDPWYWQIRYSSIDFTTVTLNAIFVHYHFDVIFTDPVTSDTNDLLADVALSRGFSLIPYIGAAHKQETPTQSSSTSSSSSNFTLPKVYKKF